MPRVGSMPSGRFVWSDGTGHMVGTFWQQMVWHAKPHSSQTTPCRVRPTINDVQWLHLVGLLNVRTKNWCTFGFWIIVLCTLCWSWWRSKTETISITPNIWMKFSGLPMNFRLNCSSNWTNCALDSHQCRPPHSLWRSQIDVKSFAVAQMDSYWHAAVVFVAVGPAFVVLAIVQNHLISSFSLYFFLSSSHSAHTYRSLLICICLILRLEMLIMNIIWRWTGRWLVL